jgi:hypothetical protein
MMTSSTMAEDWYTTWLGVAAGQRPPDFYALLCLPRFTNSPNAVEAAARAQMEKLDPHAMHPDRERREAATRMMNEIAQARMTLCDSARRRQYDAQLAQRLGVEPPPADDIDVMGETIVGAAPASLNALDIGALEAGVRPAASGDGDTPGDVLPESLFDEQTPLQDIHGDYAMVRGRRAPIPFNVVLILGGALVALAVVAAIVLITATGDSGPARQSTTATPAPIAIAPAPAPVEQTGFRDRFDDRERLGRQYEVKTGRPQYVRIDNARLVLASPDDAPVRIDLTPRRTDKLFRDASIVATVEPGVAFRFGIAATAILTVERLDNGEHHVRVSIGTVVDSAGTRSSLTLSQLDTLRIRLEREAGTIYWFINGRPVATSPEISTRGTPMIEMSATGPAGVRCTIDEINVTYDPTR